MLLKNERNQFRILMYQKIYNQIFSFNYIQVRWKWINMS